jgi:hypothetical protein
MRPSDLVKAEILLRNTQLPSATKGGGNDRE